MGFIDEKDIMAVGGGNFINPDEVIDMPKEEWAMSNDSLPPEYYTARRKQVTGQVLGTIGEGLQKGGELAASVTMPLLTWPLGKVAGATALITGKGGVKAREYEQAVHELLDPRPSEEVVTALQPLNKLMEGITFPARKIGEGIQYVTGSPAAGWTAETIGELLTFGFLPKGFKKIGDRVIGPKGQVYHVSETTKTLGRTREPGQVISGGETRQVGRPPFRGEPLGETKGRFVSPEEVVDVKESQPRTIPINREVPYIEQPQPRITGRGGPGTVENVPGATVQEQGYRPGKVAEPEPTTSMGKGEAPGEVKDPLQIALETEYKKIASEMGEAKSAFESIKMEYYRSSPSRQKRMDKQFSEARREVSELENKWNRLYVTIQGVREGKPVPSSVLAEYPELKAKAEIPKETPPQVGSWTPETLRQSWQPKPEGGDRTLLSVSKQKEVSETRTIAPEDIVKEIESPTTLEGQAFAKKAQEVIEETKKANRPLRVAGEEVPKTTPKSLTEAITPKASLSTQTKNEYVQGRLNELKKKIKLTGEARNLYLNEWKDRFGREYENKVTPPASPAKVVNKAVTAAKEQGIPLKDKEIDEILKPGTSINEKEKVLGKQVKDKIISAKSWPDLVRVAKRFTKNLHGRVADNFEEIVSEKPWDLLSQHSGVMNAKSQTAKTLKSLADDIFKETRIPRKLLGNMRGEDYQVDWDKVGKQAKKSISIEKADTTAPIISAMPKVEPQAKGEAVGEGRKVGEIIKDIGTVINEKAGLTVQDVGNAKEVKKAKERLGEDYERFKMLSESEMKDLGTYLKDAGYGDKFIKDLVQYGSAGAGKREGQIKWEGDKIKKPSDESIKKVASSLDNKKGPVNLETDIIPASDGTTFLKEAGKAKGVKINDTKVWADAWHQEAKGMAQLYPESKPIFDTTLRRSENRSSLNLKSDKLFEELINLKVTDKKAYKELGRGGKDIKEAGLFWKHDFNKMPNLDEAGLKQLGLSDSQIKAYQAKQNIIKNNMGKFFDLTKKIQLFPYENKPWFEDLKKALNSGEVPLDAPVELNNAFQKILKDFSGIKSHIGEMGSVPSYMPRTRKGGNWKVSVFDKDGNQLWMEKAFTQGTQSGLWGAQRLKKNLQKKYPDYEVRIERSVGIPESVFQGSNIHDLQYILDHTIEAMKKGQEPEYLAIIDRLNKDMEIGIADELKSRGFGRHAMGRKPGPAIGGYEIIDAIDALKQQTYALNGFITKTEAAMEYSRAMRELGMDNTNLYNFWAEHIRANMRNETITDRAGAMARTGAFGMFLMGNLKQIPLQISQGYITAMPKFSEFASHAYIKYQKAMADVARKSFSDVEKKIILEATKKGIIGDPWTQELTARTDAALHRSLKATLKFISLPISGLERFNRSTSMLAAFREFTQKKGMGYEEAFNKARDFTNDVHWLYGKENLPRVVQRFGPAGRTAYTFSAWPHQYILYLENNLRQGHYKTALSSLAWMSFFGGVMAVPFLDDIMDAAEKITGTPLRRQTQDMFRDIGKAGDVLNWGVGGIIGPGFTLQGSMKTGLPFYGTMSGKEDPFTSTFSVFGGMVSKAKKGAILASRGQYKRAMEESSPVAVSNFMAARRGYNEPLTTWKGKELYDFTDPEDLKPMQYTGGEATGKGAGFLPLRQAKGWGYTSSLNNMKNYYNERIDGFASEFVEAITSGNERKMDIIAQRAGDMQEKLIKLNIPINVGDELSRRIKLRTKPNKQQFMFQQPNE